MGSRNKINVRCSFNQGRISGHPPPLQREEPRMRAAAGRRAAAEKQTEMYSPRKWQVNQSKDRHCQKCDGVWFVEKVEADIVHRVFIYSIEMVCLLRSHAAGADGALSIARHLGGKWRVGGRLGGVGDELEPHWPLFKHRSTMRKQNT